MTKEARIKVIKYFIKNAYDASHSFNDITPAYIQGFRKAAEDAGVDPGLLTKVALTWGERWQSIKDGIKGAWQDQIVDNNLLKNLGTGLGRFGTGLMQGGLNLVSTATGALGGAWGATLSGLTGNGWKNGWNKGWDAGSNLGFGDYDFNAAKRRMSAWQQQMRDDYIERNNINVAKPEAMGMLDKLALLGSDMAETGGTGAGEALAGGALAKGIGFAAGGLANATAGSASTLGQLTNYGSRFVGGTAKFLNPNFNLGPRMGTFMAGMTLNNSMNSGGNYNRGFQDFQDLGNSNAQQYYAGVKPGDISDQITYKA